MYMFYVSALKKTTDGGFIPCRIIENKKGVHPLQRYHNHLGKDHAQAKEYCRRLNRGLGLTRFRQARLILSALE